MRGKSATPAPARPGSAGRSTGPVRPVRPASFLRKDKRFLNGKMHEIPEVEGPELDYPIGTPGDGSYKVTYITSLGTLTLPKAQANIGSPMN